MKIVEIHCRQETDCSAAVGMWNYWDHEHLAPVHKGVGEGFVVYEKGDFVVHYFSALVPFLSFLKVGTMVAMFREDENTIVLHNTMAGMPAISRIEITEPEIDRSVYHMRYRFVISGWRLLFAPLIEWYLRRQVPWWNARQWREDLPIKQRRQKVLRAGFKDFKGLPDRVEDRHYGGPLSCDLPVPRLKGSPVDSPKFSNGPIAGPDRP